MLNIMKKFTALTLNLQTQEHVFGQAEALSISIKNNLAFTRGGSFFTSAKVMVSETAHYLIAAEQHYIRLRDSYSIMYERRFSLSPEQFDYYVSLIIKENKDAGVSETYQVLIYFLAGKSDVLGGYSSSLSGDIAQVMFVSSPVLKKPDWAYERGVNVISVPTQRFIADAKPTVYIEGIQAQHVLNSVNTSVLRSLEDSDQEVSVLLEQACKEYHCLDDRHKRAFRMSQNDYRQSERASISCNEDRFYSELLNESLFVSGSGHLLEGPTYSLFGLSKEGALLCVPAKGNHSDPRSENEGKVLVSTSIYLLKFVAEALDIPILNKAIHLSELSEIAGLYAISSTRYKLGEDRCSFIPIRSIDGRALPVDIESETYTDLAKGLFNYLT